ALAVLTLILAMGYSIYSSGLGEWIAQQRTGQEERTREEDSSSDSEESETSDEALDEENVRLTVEEFSRKVGGEDSEEAETHISGEKAVLREDNLYRIFSPVVVSLAEEISGEEGVDVEMSDVRLTAERANFNENESLLKLENNVRAVGDDFSITTESVTYEAEKQRLKGSEPIRLERYDKKEDGERELEMVVTGTGLRGDLVVSSVRLQRDVEAVMMNISEEFMASGDSEDEAETGGDDEEQRTVVIRSDGPMIYTDGARQVTFKDNVRLTSDEKKLRGDKVVIQLSKKDDGGVQVEGLTAHDDVELSFEGKTATGDTLVWKNVTQTGVLTGEPAELDTPRFSVNGEELTFVRLDNRFQVDGPGELVRKPSSGEEDESSEETGGMRFSEDSPITVKWGSGMTYDAGGQKAKFRDDVVVKQDNTRLECDNMEMHFNESGDEVEKLVASGSVEITGEGDKNLRHARCETAVWEGGNRVITLEAKEGEDVLVESSTEKLYSPKVTYNPSSDRLECPVRGRLVVQEGADEDEKREAMEVTWESYMLYERSTNSQAVFQGNVLVKQPERELSSQFLRIIFDSEQDPQQVIASGDAQLDVEGMPGDDGKSKGEGESSAEGDVDQWRLNADRIEGYLQDERVEANGPGTLFIKRQGEDEDRIAWEDRMRADFAESYAEFSGEVRSEFGGSKLDSETLRLDFDENRELRHLNAKKNVRFVSTGKQEWEMEAESAEAIFAPGSVLSQIIARDDVMVRDDIRRLNSDFLVLFFQKKQEEEEQTLERAVARKKVRVRYRGEEDLEAKCAKLNWDAESDTYRLFGDPAELSKGDMEMDGEKIMIDRTSGNVSLPGGESPSSTSVTQD
ncbi:MAG: LptA/OstA family protein, partial [Planctomycetota bacterium]